MRSSSEHQNLVYFGDSLTSPRDSGKTRHADATAEILGVDDLFNFAIGGSTALPHHVAPETKTLIRQVELFLDTAPVAPEDTTALMLIGGNDIRRAMADDIDDYDARREDMIAATMEAVDALIDAGTAEVVIFSQPSVEFYPLFATSETFAGLTGFFDTYNVRLKEEVALRADAGTPVRVIDLNAFGWEMTDDPTTFGIYGRTPDDITGDVTKDEIGFIDDVHFSEAGHKVIGAFSAAALASDDVVLTEADEVHFGSAEQDLVLAAAGDDDVRGRRGDDTILAGLGEDQVAGGRGQDLLIGGSGDDHLRGGRGRDLIAGSDGADELMGGASEDTLIVGAGDKALGGGGADVFIFVTENETPGADAIELVGGKGHDRLFLVGDGTAEELMAAHNIATVSLEEVVVLNRLERLETHIDAPRLAEAFDWGLI